MDRPVCSVAVCDRPAWARGLCRAHYQRWRTTGDAGRTPVRPVQDRDGPCTVHGCDRIRKTAGLCATHYWRSRVHGDPGPAEIMTSRAGPCSVVGCDRRTVGRGLCRMHYERQRKGGEVGSAAPQRRAAGQGSITKGYLVVTVSPGRSRLAHRVLMGACWAARWRRARPSTTSTATDRTTRPTGHSTSATGRAISSCGAVGSRLANG